MTLAPGWLRPKTKINVQGLTGSSCGRFPEGPWGSWRVQWDLAPVHSSYTPLTSFLLPPLSEGCFTFIAEQKGLLQVAVDASLGERELSALTQGKPPMA